MNLSNVVTKKVAFFSSLIGTVLFLLIASTRGVPLFCEEYSRSCMKQFDTLSLFFFIFLPTLIISLITYFLREEVFRAWLKFAYVWIPVSMVLIYLAGGSSGGGFGIPNVLDQEFVSLILASLFVLLSLVIIIVKSILLRGK